MSDSVQGPVGASTVFEFPGTAQERVIFLEDVLWASDGQVNMKVLELLSLAPSVPRAFRQDFVADMLDVIDQLISSGADRTTIAKRLAFEYGNERAAGGFLSQPKNRNQPHNSRRKELSIDKMWASYLKNRSVAMRNRIVVHYAGLVHTHAARLSRKLPAQIAYDEICSAAFDGLIEAVEAYNPDRKAKFETFCQQRISGAVMDWLKSLDPQSAIVRTFEKKRVMSKEPMVAERDAAPYQAEIARHLDMSLDRYDYLARLAQLGKEVHFSGMEPPGDQHNDGSSQNWDIRDKRCEDPGVQVSRQLLVAHLTKGLSREKRLVILLYYFEEMTMAEIGSVLGLSESRVSQIHKEILKRLRHRFNAGESGELVA